MYEKANLHCIGNPADPGVGLGAGGIQNHGADIRSARRQDVSDLQQGRRHPRHRRHGERQFRAHWQGGRARRGLRDDRRRAGTDSRHAGEHGVPHHGQRAACPRGGRQDAGHRQCLRCP